MLYEKYKPKHIDDLLINGQLKQKIKNFIEQKNIPNMIIIGDIGVGKTSLLNCLALDNFKENISDYVCKINSSVEKNVKLLNDKLELFCNKIINVKHPTNRMFIIDDIDKITDKIQNLIVTLMEKHPNIIFTFTCNNISDIIETIQSRCMLFQIKHQTNDQLCSHLQKICVSEHKKFTLDGLGRICFISHGDIRESINNLQLLCDGYDTITFENVNEICAIPNPIILKDIIMECINKKIQKVLTSISLLVNDGYNSSDILEGFFDILKSDDIMNIEENVRIMLLDKICKTRYVISKKCNSLIQLNKCVIQMCQI